MLKSLISLAIISIVFNPTSAAANEEKKCPTFAEAHEKFVAMRKRFLEQNSAEMLNSPAIANGEPLISCMDSYQAALQKCDKEKTEYKYCKQMNEARPPTAGGSMKTSWDVSIAQTVDSTNCHRRIAYCTYGGTWSHRGKREKYIESCGGDARKASGDPLVIKYDAEVVQPMNDMLTELRDCWNKKGDQLEAESQQLVAKSMAVREGETAKPGVFCQNQDVPFRLCEYSGRTQAGLEETDESTSDFKDAAGTTRLEDHATSSHCSGTLIGDGVTVRTAGHCTDTPENYRQTLNVIDADGKFHTVSANCGEGLDTRDTGLCVLDRQIAAAPNHTLVLYDRSLKGANCVMKGAYVKTCGPEYFQTALAPGKTIELWSYPGSNQLTRSYGHGYFDSNRGYFYSNIPSTGGSSGGSYRIPNSTGGFDIVASTSRGDRLALEGESEAMTIDDYWVAQQRVKEVSGEKLNWGTRLAMEMAELRELTGF